MRAILIVPAIVIAAVLLVNVLRLLSADSLGAIVLGLIGFVTLASWGIGASGGASRRRKAD